MQQPDTKPGAYYVTVIDAGRVGRLLGPFFNDHAAALAMVEPVRAKANELDPKSWFYAFGTCRVDADGPAPAGILNDHFREVCVW